MKYPVRVKLMEFWQKYLQPKIHHNSFHEYELPSLFCAILFGLNYICLWKRKNNLELTVDIKNRQDPWYFGNVEIFIFWNSIFLSYLASMMMTNENAKFKG